MTLSLELSNSLNLLIEILSTGMLVLALGIVIVPNLLSIIRLYQAQSVILALITLMVAMVFLKHGIMIVFIFIPILLALYIEPLLALATVKEDMPIKQRVSRLLPWHILASAVLAQIRSHAQPTWLELRPSRRGQVFPLFASLVLVAFAYFIAFGLVGNFPEERAILPREFIQANGIAVSLSLVLLGLSILTQKQDIISQIMGLLVMEHGLFLFAIKVPSGLPGQAFPSSSVAFVLSLFVYIVITLIILAVLLPELHSRSGSIEIDDQQELKG